MSPFSKRAITTTPINPTPTNAILFRSDFSPKKRYANGKTKSGQTKERVVIEGRVV